ncbi:hypothetical protein T484DRAFT_1934550 [Baffinella frigidus]|nr:hypothetical protein T484DRAFT_1934550 [Cryptophyta sp. CCMP2293]
MYWAISPQEEKAPARVGAQALALVAVCLSMTLLSATYLSASEGQGPAALVSVSGQKGLDSIDSQIERDEALLRKQQGVVDRTEHTLETAMKGKVFQSSFHPRRPSLQAQAGTQQSLSAPSWEKPRREEGVFGSERRPESASWQEGEHRGHGMSLERKVSLEGPADQQEIDGAKVQDWNDFFNGMNTEVDVPKWNKYGLVVDNIEAIPACTVDCGKWDSDDTSDFGFFDKLNTVNERGHIIDNIDNIDACSIDC